VYVIRRVLRRAVGYYYSYLDYKQPLLYQLVKLIAAQFEQVFPEVKQQQAFIEKVIKEEEESFLRTLEKGLRRMDDIIAASAKSGIINGKDAFELYDTYGFPADLTRLIATENNLKVDEAGFENEMKQKKAHSRAATPIDTQDWVQVAAEVPVKFVGYEDLNAGAKVIKYRKVSAKGKEQYQLVLDITPFYAESGGQVGDKGKLIFENGEEIPVTDTK